MYYIYRITNLVNGKTYIGQHKYKKLHDDYMGSGKYLKRAYKKYGIENFKKDVLVFNVVEKSFIDTLEKEYIKFYRSISKAEYNIADGGQGGSGARSEETRKKISETMKGRKQSEETIRKKSQARKGKCRLEETKKRISEALRGRKYSEETLKKYSEAQQGKILSEETKRRISEAMKGKSRPNKGKHWKLVDGKRVWY